jgi:hypothetical protein
MEAAGTHERRTDLFQAAEGPRRSFSLWTSEFPSWTLNLLDRAVRMRALRGPSTKESRSCDRTGRHRRAGRIESGRGRNESPSNEEDHYPMKTDQIASGQEEPRPSTTGMKSFNVLQASLRDALHSLRKSSPDPKEPESDDTSIESVSLARLLAERRTGGWLT